jgi:hypothetical protein
MVRVDGTSNGNSVIRERSLNKRLETAGWGLLLLWSGALMLLPGDLGVLWHVWLVGAGAILLGASIVGLSLRLRPTWGTIVLGVVGLVSGIGGLARVSIPVIGLAVIVSGLVLVLTAVRSRVTTGS